MEGILFYYNIFFNINIRYVIAGSLTSHTHPLPAPSLRNLSSVPSSRRSSLLPLYTSSPNTSSLNTKSLTSAVRPLPPFPIPTSACLPIISAAHPCDRQPHRALTAPSIELDLGSLCSTLAAFTALSASYRLVTSSGHLNPPTRLSSLTRNSAPRHYLLTRTTTLPSSSALRLVCISSVPSRRTTRTCGLCLSLA